MAEQLVLIDNKAAIVWLDVDFIDGSWVFDLKEVSKGELENYLLQMVYRLNTHKSLTWLLCNLQALGIKHSRHLQQKLKRLELQARQMEKLLAK